MNRKGKAVISIFETLKKVCNLIEKGESTRIVCPCCERYAKIFKDGYAKNIRFECRDCGIIISERFR